MLRIAEMANGGSPPWDGVFFTLVASIEMPGNFNIPEFHGTFGSAVGSAPHTITFSYEGSGDAGLFGVLGSSATVHNINVTATVTGGTGSRVGAIAGQSNGLIENVNVLPGSTISGNSNVGGIIGANGSDGRLLDSTVQSHVIITGSSSNVGGLIGSNSNPRPGDLTGNTFDGSIFPPISGSMDILDLSIFLDSPEYPECSEEPDDYIPDIKEPEDEDDYIPDIKEPEDENNIPENDDEDDELEDAPDEDLDEESDEKLDEESDEEIDEAQEEELEDDDYTPDTEEPVEDESDTPYPEEPNDDPLQDDKTDITKSEIEPDNDDTPDNDYREDFTDAYLNTN